MVYDLDFLDSNKRLLFNKDSNGREIYSYNLKSVILCGASLFYPNCTLYSTTDKKYYSPVKEKISSLNLETKSNISYIESVPLQEDTPVFYFIYNTDNYYHFLYDTLPYLITYRILKKEIKNLKLLMSYNKNSNKFYKFVLELLEILNINESDILIANNDTIYANIYISSSYTHGINSNLPPRNETYSLYKEMVEKVILKHPGHVNTPENIYVSRRTWTHNNFSNIGTNYTTRRRLTNEDALVEFLNNKGFVEIFPENLSIIEKIIIFSRAKFIIGPIGGGLANVLFSKESCKLIAIVSPTFLEINQRFQYCLNNVSTSYFFNTSHEESGPFKKFMRVKTSSDLIGEIEEVYKNYILIAYTKDKIAGWNNNVNYEKTTVKKEDCIRLDDGLNSAWSLDLETFKNLV